MTIISDTRVARLLRVAARTGHQHSGDERVVEEVINEVVTSSDVVSLPPGSLITLQRGPGAGLTEEGSVLNLVRDEIGGVAGGQTTSVSFYSEDSGTTSASIFVTEKDFSVVLTSPGDYAVNYKTFQIKTYTTVPTTPGSRILITYAWAPIREYLRWDPEDLTPDLISFGIGPHAGGGGTPNVSAGCNINIETVDGYAEIAVDVASLAGPGLLVAFGDTGCPQLEVDAVAISNLVEGCGIELVPDGGSIVVGLDFQGIAGDGLVVVPNFGCPQLNVQLDAYQVPFDDTNSPFAYGKNVQAALESIDGYLQDLRGNVIRVSQAGADAINAPLNTIYEFGSQQYEIGSGRLLVYVNGIFQNRFEDYAELSTSQILFSDALSDEDELDVVIFSGNFAGGQDLASFTMQLGYDNSFPKEINLDNGEISYIQTQPIGSVLRLYSQTSLTTVLNIIQDGSGSGITAKSVDSSNPTLLLKTDTPARNTLINSVIIDRTTSHISGAQTNIGSAILTRLENAGTILFNASRISTIATDATDATEDVDWRIELMSDGVFGERLRLKGDGKLGLGTATPSFKLTVAGIVGPATDITYGLGTAAYRWRDGYFGQAGLFLMSTDSETIDNNEWSLRIGAREYDGYFEIAHDNNTIAMFTADGHLGVDVIPNEPLTVGGSISLQETVSPINSNGFGKIYAKSLDSKLYFMNSSGVEIDISTSAFQTIGNITLSVNGVSGSDTPTSTRSEIVIDGYHGDEPFATIQGAIDALPNIIHKDHSVVINIESGNYAGFSVAGKIIGSDQFSIIGDINSATLLSGITTGVASSGTISTLTSAGAGWTVDNLEGKYLSITAGTGGGFTYLIKSNTADTITVVYNMSVVPDGTTIFDIVEPRANIISNGPDLAGIYINKVYGNILIFGLNIDGVTSGIRAQASENIDISQCKISNTTNGLKLLNINKINIAQTKITSSTDTAVLLNNIFNISDDSKGIVISNSLAGISINNSASNFAGIYMNTITNTAVEINHSILSSFISLQVDGAALGLSSVNSFVEMSQSDLSNCTNTFDITGSRVKFLNNLTGTGNSGFGVLCNSPHSLVEISGFTPIITGAEGDASINGIDVLDWDTDFGINNTSSLNNITGARIVRVA